MSIVKRGLKIDFSRDHIFYYGIVKNVNDPQMAGRIQVRIVPDDKDIVKDRDLPWCFPLLPKFFNVVPKVDEAVRLLMYTTNKNKTDINRAYMGPVIGQPQNLLKETKRNALITGSDIGFGRPEIDPKELKLARGIYPNEQDVAIQGRDNSDIILNPREINLRAGKFLKNDPLTLNTESPARIQLKQINNDNSAATIIASKITLVSYDSQLQYSEANNYTKLESEGLNNGIEDGNPSIGFESPFLQRNTQPLVYGNLLLEYLRHLTEYIKSHQHHDGEGSPINGIGAREELLKFNLNSLISPNIRIN